MLPLPLELRPPVSSLQAAAVLAIGNTVGHALPIADAPPEGAIVPYLGAGEDAGYIRDQSFAIGALLEHGAFRAPIMFDRLATVSVGVLQRMQEERLVRLDTTVFGELTVCLHSQALSPSGAYILSDPVPALRSLPTRNPMALPKLVVIFMLREAGWTKDANVEAYDSGMPLKYISDTRPKSYYVALLKCDEVFDKGVLCIEHKAKDHYYRCLLNLSSDQLVAILDGDPNVQPDEYWKRAIEDAGGEDDDSNSGDEPPPPPRLGDAPRLHDAAANLPLADRVNWRDSIC